MIRRITVSTTSSCFRDDNHSRIVSRVNKHIQKALVMQAHLDIHHQHYRKVHKLLRPLYYWPKMDADIELICKSCLICQAAKVRRQKLQADFDAQALQAFAKPRQHYGMDFYAIHGGEILVIVDLGTTILGELLLVVGNTNNPLGYSG